MGVRWLITVNRAAGWEREGELVGSGVHSGMMSGMEMGRGWESVGGRVRVGVGVWESVWAYESRWRGAYGSRWGRAYLRRISKDTEE